MIKYDSRTKIIIGVIMDRERITISIKKSVLNRIDEVIDGTTIRNRSHAFESLVLSALGAKETEGAVLLLGGDNALKNIPVVEKIFADLKKSGFTKINIATGFLGDKVKEKLGDGSQYGLELKYNSNGEGSGGALSILKKELKNTFIVINTDKYTMTDYQKLLRYHRKHNSSATIAVADLDQFAGTYVFEPSIFDSIPKGFSMLEDDVLPKLIQEERLVVYPLVK